jgi:hypothetical protein
MIASPKLPSADAVDSVDNVDQRGQVETTDRPVGRGGWEVARYACVDNFVEGDADGWVGRWSDHRAVRATFAKAEA